MKSLVWTTLFTAIAAVNTGRGINQEHTRKVYIDTHPVVSLVEQNPFLSIPGSPAIVTEGNRPIQIDVPVPSDTYVWKLTGHYQAQVSGPHKFSTGEVRRAMFHVGRPNSDVFNSGDKDTPNHDAFASSPMTKVLESGVVYSVTVVYIAGTENVPAYVKSPDGVKHKLEGKMKQASTRPGTSDEGSSSESPADSESEALPSTPHTDSEFKYSVYLIPHRAAAEKAIREFWNFPLVQEGVLTRSGVKVKPPSTKHSRLTEVMGHFTPPVDGTYKIAMGSGLLASLQIGPGSEETRNKYRLNDDWKVSDTRVSLVSELGLTTGLFYPFRLVFSGEWEDILRDMAISSPTGAAVDLLGLEPPLETPRSVSELPPDNVGPSSDSESWSEVGLEGNSPPEVSLDSASIGSSSAPVEVSGGEDFSAGTPLSSVPGTLGRASGAAVPEESMSGSFDAIMGDASGGKRVEKSPEAANVAGAHIDPSANVEDPLNVHTSLGEPKMVAPPETALPSSQPFASSENIHASSADEMGFDTASLARNNSGWISGSESPVFPSSSFESPVLTGSFERPGISISLDNPLTRPTTSASATLTSSSLLQNISYTEHADTTNRSEHSLAYATPTGSISTGFVVQKGSPLVKISNSANLLLDVNINFEGCLPGSDCASTKSPGFVSSKGSVLGMAKEPVKGDKYESNACQLMPADSLGSFKDCTSFFESSHVDGSVGLDGSAKGIGQDIGRGTISTQLEPVESKPSMGMKTSLEGSRHDNSEPLASVVYHQENVISASVESETSREQRETTAVIFEGAGSRVVADLCLVVGGVLLLI